LGLVAADTDRFRTIVNEHWARIYNFAFRMVLDRERAPGVVEETFLRAYVGMDNMPEDDRAGAWLMRITQHVLEKILPRKPEVTFDTLDDTLRSEATRTDLVKSVTDPKRDFLLWELKQGCMTAVINCLSPGERSAFTLSNVMGMADDEAAAVLGVTNSAYKVRLSRARKKVTDYLAPRCEHVDPMNPCRCPARVGVALKKGFIRSTGEVSLRKQPVPFGRYGAGPDQEDAPLRDVSTIYRNLPEPDPPEELLERLLELVGSEEWERVRSRKLAQQQPPA